MSTGKRDFCLELNKDSVIVLTGGAQGITAEVAKDLARHFTPNIVILDLVAIPDNIESIASFSTQELDDFKRSLHDTLKQKHDRVTPVMLEREFSKYTRGITAYHTVQELEALGAHVSYYHCDVTDEKTFKSVPKWFNDLRGYLPDIPCILLANKDDLDGHETI